MKIDKNFVFTQFNTNGWLFLKNKEIHNKPEEYKKLISTIGEINPARNLKYFHEGSFLPDKQILLISNQPYGILGSKEFDWHIDGTDLLDSETFKSPDFFWGVALYGHNIDNTGNTRTQFLSTVRLLHKIKKQTNGLNINKISVRYNTPIGIKEIPLVNIHPITKASYLHFTLPFFERFIGDINDIDNLELLNIIKKNLISEDEIIISNGDLLLYDSLLALHRRDYVKNTTRILWRLMFRYSI